MKSAEQVVIKAKQVPKCSARLRSFNLHQDSGHAWTAQLTKFIHQMNAVPVPACVLIIDIDLGNFRFLYRRVVLNEVL